MKSADFRMGTRLAVAFGAVVLVEDKADKEREAAKVAKARNLLIGTNLFGVALAALFGWLITRSITQPMNRAKDAATRVRGQAQQLVQAVAVFRLSQGDVSYVAAPMAHNAAPASMPAAERRSAARAKNVTRPAFGAKAKAEPPTLTAQAHFPQNRHRGRLDFVLSPDAGLS